MCDQADDHPYVEHGASRLARNEPLIRAIEYCLSRSPGVAVAAIDVEDIVFSDAKGFSASSDVMERFPVSAENTAFQVASISKTFLAILALQGVERGELDLDADINQYLSAIGITVEHPQHSEAKITSAQLLRHCSGLTDDECALLEGEFRVSDLDCTITLQEYVTGRLVGNVNIWGRTNAYPGQARYHYSNAGFTLLALVVECAAGGASLQSLAKRFIFDPLEMCHTSYTLAELRASGDVHVAVPSYSTRESVGLYGVAEWPACQVRSTLGDMTRYLRAMTCPPEKCPILSAAARCSLTPASMRDGLAWWGKDAQYGDRSGREWSHGGYMEGIRTHIYLWPCSGSASGSVSGPAPGSASGSASSSASVTAAGKASGVTTASGPGSGSAVVISVTDSESSVGTGLGLGSASGSGLGLGAGTGAGSDLSAFGLELGSEGAVNADSASSSRHGGWKGAVILTNGEGSYEEITSALKKLLQVA